MIKIALTGNIASGKSEAEKILSDKGFMVFDADKISCEIFFREDVQIKLKDLFNTVQKKEIADIVFNNSKERKKLEELLHPLIKKEIENIFEKNKKEDKIFISVPLLFEAKMQDMFDKTVLICTNENIRLARLTKRNNLTKEEALKRIKSQMREDDKRAYCDFVIENNGSREKLLMQLNQVLKAL